VLVLLEGDVPTDHVEEEDAEGPHGERIGRVAGEPDPLGRGVNSGPVKVGVLGVFEEGTGAKVDELEAASAQVHEDVLVLDVAMDDPLAMAGYHCLHNLTEEVPGTLFVKNSFLCDEVEQIFRVVGSLHDIDVAIGALIVLEQLDDTLNVLDRMKQFQLQRNSFAVQFIPFGHFGFGNMFDGDLFAVPDSGASIHCAEPSLS